MRASYFEFRFRLLIGVLLYVLGFWAPWLRYGAAPGHFTTTWLELTGFVASHHWLGLEAASRILTSLAILSLALGAALRVAGTAYLGSDTVQSPEMHAQSVVAAGPYRHTRNPLYLGSILVAIAVSMLMPFFGALFFVIATILQFLRLILAEEAFLSRQQGTSYTVYKALVPRLVPSAMPRVAGSALRPSWGQALLCESYPVSLAVCFAVLAWNYNAEQLTRAVLICFGGSIIVRAFLPRK